MAFEMSLDYRLRWLDFDRYGRLRPETVLDLFQDVATIQAADMGIGADDMRRRGVFWAVVRMRYEIAREPRHHQIVTARTWPHTLTSFSFLRDFQLLDDAGDLLVKASSEWVVMDIETRKFAKVKSLYDGPTDFVEERSFDSKLRKVPDFEEGNRPIYEAAPAYCDIDLNGHVNNARYTNFVVNALNPGKRGSVKSFQIDYRHEALPGEALRIHTHVHDAQVLAKGMRPDGTTSFACAIELAEE